MPSLRTTSRANSGPVDIPLTDGADHQSRPFRDNNGDCGAVWQRPIRCHGSVVMAGWRCPEVDASSLWLKIIRNGLVLLTPTMIAVLCETRVVCWRNWR